jgi:hypothetical protein
MSVLIEHNLHNMIKGIKTEKATDVKDSAHHAQNTTMRSFWQSQPLACPDHDVVGERAQRYQHVLCVEALFIAFGQSQSLFVTFESGLDASPALITRSVT